MLKVRQSVWLLALFIAILLFFGFAWLPGLNRTNCGRITRFILGSPLAQQYIDDQTRIVRTADNSQRLLQWASSMRLKYVAGDFRGGPRPDFNFNYPPDCVVIPNSDVPEWLSEALGKPPFGPLPQAWISPNDDGTPGFVIYGWYMGGVAIGPAATEYLSFTWRFVEAAPGIYSYATEK